MWYSAAMRTVRNILFVTLVGICICSFFGYRGIATVFNSVEAPKSSYLEGRKYTPRPKVSIESVSKGVFQSEAEQFVADRVPFRDDVLLANASFQRSLIEFANVPFGYEIYHAYYGSTHALWPAQERSFELPRNLTRTQQETLEITTAGLAELVDLRPDVRWVFYLVDRMATSPVSPAFEYMSGVPDNGYFLDAAQRSLPESCTIIDGSYSDQSEFLKDMFTVDHHWRISGAVRAYYSIVDELGFEPLSFEQYRAFNGPWYGFSARAARFLSYSDYVDDVHYNRSTLLVEVAGKLKGEEILDYGYRANAQDFALVDPCQSAYEQWFHPVTPVFSIVNENALTDRTLLIINDSYGNCMQRFLAEHYRTTYVIDPRRYKKPIRDFLSSHDDIDDVVVLMSTISLKEYESRAALAPLEWE